MDVTQRASAVARSDEWRLRISLAVANPADVLAEGEGGGVRSASLHGWGRRADAHIIQFLCGDGLERGGRRTLGVGS